MNRSPDRPAQPLPDPRVAGPPREPTWTIVRDHHRASIDELAVIGAPGRDRTYDSRFRKPMLSPLSYWGGGWQLGLQLATGQNATGVGRGVDGWRRTQRWSRGLRSQPADEAGTGHTAVSGARYRRLRRVSGVGLLPPDTIAFQEPRNTVLECAASSLVRWQLGDNTPPLQLSSAPRAGACYDGPAVHPVVRVGAAASAAPRRS